MLLPHERGGRSKSIRYFNFTGTVSYADGDRLVVTVPDNAPVAELQATEGLGVQLFFDETSYRLMFEALDRVIAHATTALPICATCSIRACRLPN